MSRSISAITLGLSALVLLTACSSTPQAAKAPSEDSTTRIARMSEQARLDQENRVRESAAESRRMQNLERQSVPKSTP